VRQLHTRLRLPDTSVAPDRPGSGPATTRFSRQSAAC